MKIFNKNKYGAKKTTIGGKTYDSKKEAKRAVELSILHRAGLIKELKSQVSIDLIPSAKYQGKTIRGVRYIADFTYFNKEGVFIIEDVKSPITRKNKDYIIKKKLVIQKILSGEILENTLFIES